VLPPMREALGDRCLARAGLVRVDALGEVCLVREASRGLRPREGAFAGVVASRGTVPRGEMLRIVLHLDRSSGPSSRWAVVPWFSLDQHSAPAAVALDANMSIFGLAVIDDLPGVRDRV
jgi:hypothetical protein